MHRVAFLSRSVRAHRIVGLLFLFAILSTSPSVQAQVDTGAIVGTVRDGSGGVLPTSKITLREESTGATSTATSGNDGSYSFSPVRLGTYTLTVEKDGFRTTERQHLNVTIQSRLEVNFDLQPGEVSQRVEVSSSEPLLQTQSSSIQTLVDGRTINDLPLNGRNAAFLAQLSPGVTFAQGDSRGLGASGSFTANGSRRSQNSYLLDGMDDTVAIGDLVNQTQYVVMPPPDALREFTVQTSTYSAQFGHAAGAVLNVSTKSGGNQLHGTLWEFLRNDYFDAKDYFIGATQRKPSFRQNQFGAAIGGPIRIPGLYDGRDRSFFFADYQGQRIVQGKPYTRNVPTLAQSNSGYTDFRDLITLQTGTRTDALNRVFPSGTIFDPATTRAVGNTFVRDPFYNGSVAGITNFTTAAAIAQMNQISASRLSPSALALIKLYPSATQGGLTGNYVTAPKATTNIDSFDTRFDHTFTQRDSVFARYSFVYTKSNLPGPFPGVADGAASRPGSGYTQAQNVALSETHIFSSRVVNEARIGYSKVFDVRLPPGGETLGIPAQYGIGGVPQISGNGGLPLFNFGQLGDLGSAGTLPSRKSSNIVQGTENVSVDGGRHQSRFGVEYQHIGFPMLTPTSSRGNFQYSGIYTSVVNNTDASTDRAQFLLSPRPSSVPGGINNVGGANVVSATSFPPTFDLARQYVGIYAQDDWRVTDRLTLNLGARYEIFGVSGERGGRHAYMVPAAAEGNTGGVSRYYVPNSQLGNLSTSFLAQLTSNNIVLTPQSNNVFATAQKNNVAPRIGFSYQASNRLVTRGGYGLFFQGDENHGLSIRPTANFPFQVTTNYNAVNAWTPLTADNSVGTLENGLTNVPLSGANGSVTSLSLFGEPIRPKTTYTQAFNLQLQYQLGNSTVAELGYVGTVGRHLQTGIPTNAISSVLSPSVAAPANFRFYPGFALGGTYLTRNGSSNYNSVQASITRRFSHGFAFMANFTFSRCLSNARDMLDTAVGGYRAPYVPGVGISADNGLCEFHTSRVVHTSGTYELPFGRNRKFLTSGIGNAVAGGWSTNWIFTAQDGQPFTVSCSTTTTLGLGCYALKVPGQDPYAGQHNANQFLNPAAFANPSVATATTAVSGGSLSALGGSATQVTGPPFRRLDLSVVRRFTIFRESYLEFRAETFNLTNTPNLALPGTLNFTNASTFARITSTRNNPNDARQIQLSLKYYF